MKVKKIKVPIYDFNVTYIEIENKEDADTIPKYFKPIKVEEEDACSIIETIKEEGKNGGSTFRNFGLKGFLIIIYEADNEASLKNVKAHELRHLTDRILEWADIKDNEAAAFLQGYLFEKLY